jgi:uncharacterized protein YndB with AHSA1/START domain/DNA-binding transcriptional ArsR family regulator
MVPIRRKPRNIVFRAIADPTRRRILGLLLTRPQTVGEIAGNFSMSRPAISKHLRLLRSAGLVVSRRQGTASRCSLNARPLRAVNEWLRDYEIFWAESLENLKSYVEKNTMNPARAKDTIAQEITINGTAERIFQALTNPEERLKWWGGPEGRFKLTHFESDLRAGGKWIMHAESFGRAVTIHGEYREIVRPHLLVFTWLADWYENASESLVRWDLTEKDGVTTVRLTHSGLLTEAARENHRGWPKILEWLKAYIE